MRTNEDVRLFMQICYKKIELSLLECHYAANTFQRANIFVLHSFEPTLSHLRCLLLHLTPEFLPFGM